jgi:hypothetical protein
LHQRFADELEVAVLAHALDEVDRTELGVGGGEVVAGVPTTTLSSFECAGDDESGDGEPSLFWAAAQVK